MKSGHDSLIDSCLEEILGNENPPDLSGPILQSLAARLHSDQRKLQSIGVSDPVAPPIAEVRQSDSLPKDLVTPRVDTRQSRPASHRRRLAAFSLTMIGLVLFAIAGFWWRERTDLASQPVVDRTQSTANLPDSRPDSNPKNKNRRQQVTIPIEQPEGRQDVYVTPPPFPTDSEVAGELDRSRQPVNRYDHSAPSTESAIVAFINQFVHQAWSDNGVSASEQATEEEWCRRTFLRVLGRIPTIEELEKFVRNSSADKRDSLLASLLNSPGTADEFSQHWANIWANILVGRSNRESFASREDLLNYLQSAFRRNVSYEVLARQLITATGTNDRSSPDYNGAINFVLANHSDRGLLVTSKTSQVFLGVQVQCAQCHDHPTTQLVQDQFWQLNAYFRQLAVDLDPVTRFASITNRDFAGEGRADSMDGEVYFEQPNGRVRAAYPVFLDGSSAPKSGRLSDADRRQLLAEQVVRSPNFARVMVNRIWAHFLGFGFTRPVDDLGPHNGPAHEELLDHLASEFIAHDYDVRKLIRWVALSEPFGLSSRIAAGNSTDLPEQGQTPLFSRYYSRQMQVEELVQSLELLVNGLPSENGSSLQLMARKSFSEFSKSMDTDDGAEENTFTGGIPQHLFLMNSELARRVLSTEQGSLLNRIVTSRMPIDQKVEHLFEATLSRKPSKREALAVRALLEKNVGNEPNTLQDVWWALLNSNEFVLDH